MLRPEIDCPNAILGYLSHKNCVWTSVIGLPKFIGIGGVGRRTMASPEL